MMPSAPHSDVRPVLTAEAMRWADEVTIEEFGIPGFTLMETAGREAARILLKEFLGEANGPVHIYCGKGNNGGDGLVIGRKLASHGVSVRAFLLGTEDDLSQDAATNLRLLKKIGQHEGKVDIVLYEKPQQLDAYPEPAVHVDALLGTGLSSDLRNPIGGLVDWLNTRDTPTVAIDMPTGLHTDTGSVMGTATHAAATITMGALKAGLLMNDGRRFAGSIRTVEIGIPPFVLHQAATREGCALLPTDEFVRQRLPTRSPNAYKYSVGFALVVAGAPGMTGAPIMTSTAAARAGAGYVTCASPATAQEALSAQLTEVTTLGLPTNADGGIDPDSAMEAIADRMEKAQALAIGPGLGREPGTATFVQRLLQHTSLPTVIDADALNALSDDWLAEHGRRTWILTPHAGEFSRLAPDADRTNRLQTAQHYARRWNCILLLKGPPTLVAAPDGTTYATSTGNAGLATAGTGDVLTGITAGLCAQGLEPLDAALCATHLGGACAERYASKRDLRSMMATDLLSELPAVLHERFST